MGTLTLGFPDYANTAEYSGGDWEATLPLDNLTALPLGVVARSSSAAKADTKMDVALQDPISIGLMALCAHNLSTSATYRLTGSANAGMSPTLYDSGWLSAEVESQQDYASTNHLFHVLTSPVEAQYWRVELDDTSNTAGYIQAGRLILAPAWSPAITYDYGSEFGYESDVESETSLGGQRYFTRVAHRRVLRVGFSWLTSTEHYDGVLELQRIQGLDREFFVVPDPDDSTYRTRRSFLARLSALDLVSHPMFLYYRTALQFVEVL